MRTKIETTNTVNGLLEHGGICGRIVSYDAAEIAKIMDCTEAEASKMDGSEIVPGTSQVNLAAYLNYHGYKGHVVRTGHIIQ